MKDFKQTPKGYTCTSESGHKYFISGVHQTAPGSKHAYWAKSVARMDYIPDEKTSKFVYLSDAVPEERNKKITILKELNEFLTK